MSVLFANVRSALNKHHQLSSAVDSCSADIVALTETWLHEHVRDHEIFETSSQFNIYRCDRTARRGGGVLLAISKNISSSPIHIHSDLEIIWVSLTLNHHAIILGVCYRPPSSSHNFVSELHDALNLVYTRFPSSKVILMGDFNFPNITWNTQPPSLSPFSTLANDFIDLCSTFSLSQLVTQPTRRTSNVANILDLVLTTRPDLISSISQLPGISDHSLLTFSLNITRPNASNTRKTIHDYGKANFAAINDELSTFIDHFFQDFDNRSVESNWNIFSCKIHELIDQFIPSRTITSNAHAPWYNAHIKRLSNKKKRMYRRAKLAPSSTRWTAYKLASETYVSALKNAKNKFLSSVLPSMLKTNTRKFWRVINPPTDNSITLVDSFKNPISACDCASVLNDTFIKNFSATSDFDLPNTHCYDYVIMPPVVVDAPGIVKLIETLPNHSSPGHDGINVKFLKNTSALSSIILARIFQQSIDSSSLPPMWKIGKIVPVFKSGDKTNPVNYRPISLTSVCCKLLEHVIFRNLVNFLETNSFFTPAQHGFRKTYSCETQLISFTHKLHCILDRSSCVDCIFLDFSKAFDKVSHKLLLYKLQQLNIDSSLLMWIECFLTHRSQFVSANGHNSLPGQVHSGVPQGSVLGPLLFLIYINDLPSLVKSNVHLFADDCVIFREVLTDYDTNTLQSDLNVVANWCNSWRMELNINKCKTMRVSRINNTSFCYYLNDTPLEAVDSYKYLGVHITSNLTWSLHIQNIINNANRMLGYLRRNFYNAPLELKLLLFKTLIRSKLEYATTVWDPHHENLINALEMVQNNSVRFILSNYSRGSSITAMKSIIGLPSLSSRRKVSRLTLFHKLYHHVSLRNELIPRPVYFSSRIDHRHKVGFHPSNTKAFYQSFVPLTSREWNHLPEEIVTIADNQLFRACVANIV